MKANIFAGLGAITAVHLTAAERTQFELHGARAQIGNRGGERPIGVAATVAPATTIVRVVSRFAHRCFARRRLAHRVATAS